MVACQKIDRITYMAFLFSEKRSVSGCTLESRKECNGAATQFFPIAVVSSFHCLTSSQLKYKQNWHLSNSIRILVLLH